MTEAERDAMIAALPEKVYSLERCQYRAHHAGMKCTVTAESTLEERKRFSEVAIALWRVKLRKVERRFGPITRETNEATPSDVTCDQILAGDVILASSQASVERRPRTKRRRSTTRARAPARPERPPRLEASPAALADARRILDGAARRLLAESVS